MSSSGIKEAAADWISRRDAGLSPAEEQAFQVWLAADSRHVAAVDALQPAWSAINQPRHSGRGSDLRRYVAGRVALKQRRRYMVALSSVAAAAVVAFAFISRPTLPSSEPGPTIALRPDRQLLSDGSSVELNFGAEIATDFTPEKRSVRLLQGEALFHVSQDESRPFVVTAGHVAVRAVGTAFSVRFDPEKVDVLVTEGRVAVEQKPASNSMVPLPAPASTAETPEHGTLAAPVFLSAGRRLVIPAEKARQPPASEIISSAEVRAALAWRNRRVEFNGTPLAEAVEIFNRDNAVQLSVSTRAVGELRISGVFWTNNSEAFSRVVETSLGIKAVQLGGGKIVLQP